MYSVGESSDETVYQDSHQINLAKYGSANEFKRPRKRTFDGLSSSTFENMESNPYYFKKICADRGESQLHQGRPAEVMENNQNGKSLRSEYGNPFQSLYASGRNRVLGSEESLLSDSKSSEEKFRFLNFVRSRNKEYINPVICNSKGSYRAESKSFGNFNTVGESARKFKPPWKQSCSDLENIPANGSDKNSSFLTILNGGNNLRGNGNNSDAPADRSMDALGTHGLVLPNSYKIDPSTSDLVPSVLSLSNYSPSFFDRSSLPSSGSEKDSFRFSDRIPLRDRNMDRSFYTESVRSRARIMPTTSQNFPPSNSSGYSSVNLTPNFNRTLRPFPTRIPPPAYSGPSQKLSFQKQTTSGNGDTLFSEESGYFNDGNRSILSDPLPFQHEKEFFTGLNFESQSTRINFLQDVMLPSCNSSNIDLSPRKSNYWLYNDKI